MTKRVGLAIAHDTMRAVVVMGTRLIWAGETSREPGAPTAEDVRALLTRAPLARWRRTPVAVAVGPHASQMKRIVGLPPIDDTRIMGAVVRENAGTFFLQNGVPLAVTGVRKVEAGSVWAAAVETTHVACVRQACRATRLKLCSIAPAAVVLPHGVRSESFHWADGPVTLEITHADAQPTTVRRVTAALGNGAAPPEAVAALEPLGENAARFADAYGAAVASLGDPLTLGPGGDVPWERRRLQRRLLPPVLMAVLAAAALLLSPFYAVTVARQSETSLRAIQASEAWRITGEVLPQLERATTVLTELERFAASRPQRTPLLAALATSLPERTAIVRLEINNDEARVIVVTPRAPEAIAAIEAIPGVASVTNAGQVARQNIGGTELDRVTLTFQYRTRTAIDSVAGAPR